MQTKNINPNLCYDDITTGQDNEWLLHIIGHPEYAQLGRRFGDCLAIRKYLLTIF